MKTSITSILTAGATLFLGLHAAPVRADILYVGDTTSPPDILKFTSGGASSVFANVPNGLNTPGSFAFDSAGNLFVGNINTSAIQKITPAGVISTFVTTGAGQPFGIAFDAAGNLYAALNNLNTIAQFTPGGVSSVFASGLNNPLTVAFDSAGNLYTNDGANTIERFTPGGFGSVVVSGTGVNSPRSLAFDLADNLYVANDADNTIEKFTTGGIGSVFATSGVTHPTGIAFDSVGNLYVANAGNNTIREFSSTGNDLGNFASSGLHFPRPLAFTNDAGVPLPLANGYPVPEPSTWAMLGLGLPALLGLRRRKA